MTTQETFYESLTQMRKIHTAPHQNAPGFSDHAKQFLAEYRALCAKYNCDVFWSYGQEEMVNSTNNGDCEFTTHLEK
jgi:hypothetical protein